MQQSSCRVAPKQPETHLELPPPDTKRWSSRRKAAVVVATRTGILSRVEACQRYMLSDEELADWEVAFDRRGIPGLRSASLHLYRDGPKPSEEAVPVRERA
ncbi:MAG TPA: DUF1153 domain-containing protein [Stellaceae bacterium]|nr:DUF1153 domain-containing protein [Stellaceae bacterium]